MLFTFQLYDINAGIAVNKPKAVATSASEIPGATTAVSYTHLRAHETR